MDKCPMCGFEEKVETQQAFAHLHNTYVNKDNTKDTCVMSSNAESIINDAKVTWVRQDIWEKANKAKIPTPTPPTPIVTLNPLDPNSGPV